jgi:C4-dicarboxylate transporter DctM subunit
LVIAVWIIGISLILDFTLANFSVTLFEGLSSYALLSLPLFILAGDVMRESGVAKRLADFAFSLLSWLRGGMALTSIGACGLFAAISGSNSATTAAVGAIMYPEMKRQGFDEGFSAATIAAGGVVGIIIPPSIVFIVYGVLLGLPVGDLFIAGLLPGIVLIATMQITAYFLSRRNGWGTVFKLDLRQAGRAAIRAYLGIATIGIVLFGIYSGIFSPTEAAAITVGFALLTGLASKAFSFKRIPTVFVRSAQVTAMLAPVVAVSIVLQQMFAILGVQSFITSLFDTVTSGYYGVIFLCMAIILLSGMILESIPNTIVFAPILAPIAHGVGVEPIHFAVIFLVGTSIGFITPPYGLNIYVASGVTGISYLRIVKSLLPYILMLLISWVLIVFNPQLSLMFVPGQ